MANTWEWKEYDDGSGGLRKPDGSSFFSYDMATKEYMFASDAEPGFFNDGNWNYYGDREQFNLKEFAENAAVNDSINKAFDISKSFISVKAPKNGRFYSNEERCEYINKALDEILNAISIEGVKPEEIEALVRGKDATEHGKFALYFIRPNAKQIQAGLDWNWELSDVIKGYTIGENGEFSKGEMSVMKIDDMQLFDSDIEAAEQAQKDGVKLIPKRELNFGRGNDMKNYRYIDTPENRVLLSKYISKEKRLNIEKDFWKQLSDKVKNSKTPVFIVNAASSIWESLSPDDRELIDNSMPDFDEEQDYEDFLKKQIENFNEKKTNADYIHSEEFISKFGDWEKANRLEKLKNAESIISDGKIIISGDDFSKEVSEAREKGNLKVLKLYARDIGYEQKGFYFNVDQNEKIQLSMRNISEIYSHHLSQKGHIEAMMKIGDIIKNAIWIEDIKNEDTQKNPRIEKYSYFASGLNIGGIDYTAKSVIATDKDGNHYYDQRLSEIEKGKLVEILTQRMSRENSTESLSKKYDKRLIEICQVPQMPYLEMKDGKWNPKEEAIQAVKDGKLYIEKIGQNYQMHDSSAKTGQFLKLFIDSKTNNKMLAYTHEEKDEWNGWSTVSLFDSEDKLVTTQLLDSEDLQSAADFFANDYKKHNLWSNENLLEVADETKKVKLKFEADEWVRVGQKETYTETKSKILADSFNTLNTKPEVWKYLIEHEHTLIKDALYVAASDAFLGDNLRWLIENGPEEQWLDIKQNKKFCEEILTNAENSITNDSEYTINPTLELAEKIGMTDHAINFCKKFYEEIPADDSQKRNGFIEKINTFKKDHEKHVVEDFFNKLSTSHVYPSDRTDDRYVLASANFIRKNYLSSEERKIIDKFISKSGAKSEKALADFLKLQIEPNKKIKRGKEKDIEIER